MKRLVILIALIAQMGFGQSKDLTYPIVDTDQHYCYSDEAQISAPNPGEDFYGQDAQYVGNQPNYVDNGDGTVTDQVTGLMWQKYLYDDKYTYEESFDVADTATIAGYDDWRLPTVKELYSLILFSGKTMMTSDESIPYLNTDYFEFRWGDEDGFNDRFIDVQFASTSTYISVVMNGQPGMFGLNLADGRIKCYPQSKDFEVRLVRGNPDYGINDFVDNGDGTITDNATGLMWDKSGSSEGMNWKDALAYVQQLNANSYLGYDDWRLPNIKELQSLTDYSEAPDVTGFAAIDPIFDIPEIIDEQGNTNYPFYWSSTTHLDGPTASYACYVAFGEALGFMSFPPDMELKVYDVHGAGAQRSDPKYGDPNDYPEGHGPQGDVIRIYNYVRAVRDVQSTTNVGEVDHSSPTDYSLEQNFPNPFNPSTRIRYTLANSGNVQIKVFDMLGQEIVSLVNTYQESGNYSVVFDASSLSSGTYLYSLQTNEFSSVKKMIVLK